MKGFELSHEEIKPGGTGKYRRMFYSEGKDGRPACQEVDAG